MGKLINVEPMESRIYQNPKDPKNSNYTVKAPVTALEFVLDYKTGQSAAKIISDMQEQILLSTQEPAALAASFLGRAFLE